MSLKKFIFLPVTLFAFLSVSGVAVAGIVQFPSTDGITVTADLYMAHDAQEPFIVLFHQAGWSRGEYLEIAPRLNSLGFNCMAVDIRSGGGVNGVANKTVMEAKKAGKGTRYVDTLPDMAAAIDYARKKFARGKLIIWGSSYSAALVLKIAGDNPASIDGVLSFSPGEYFSRQGKSKNWIKESAVNIKSPVFITSAKGEKGSWFAIYEAIPPGGKVFYLPGTKGNHGSRALWKKFKDSPGYWKAVEKFLRSFLN